MKALAVGGTGATGPFVIAALLQRGYQLSVLHRGLRETARPAGVEHTERVISAGGRQTPEPGRIAD
jgi:uncharacterized protein YbjT (DUF2867 family)